MNEARYADSGLGVGFRHRSAYRLLTSSNGKTLKGEKAGYLSAILYLLPHTSGGGPTLCPHSTDDCRSMCLSAAGLSGLPKAMGAKLRRTQMFNDRRPEFMALLTADIMRLHELAAEEGLEPVLRLNGTSDVLWERLVPGWSRLPIRRMDYTKIPLHLRRVDPGYHLTYSYMGPADAERAAGYLAAGHSVAVVVPPELKDKHVGESGSGWWAAPGRRRVPLVDGDAHDLRFLDPPGSLVLLKPKGHLRSSLIRPDVLSELARVI